MTESKEIKELKEKIIELECDYGDMQEMYLLQIERLEKALDKASETLAKSKFKMTCGEAIKTCMENHCFGYSCVHSRNFTKEEWKAWALNEKA